MKSRFLGEEVETEYFVQPNKNEMGKFVGKPFIYTDTKIQKWVDLVPEINEDVNLSCPWVRISETENETEVVHIKSKEYCININTWMYYTDKIVTEKTINKDKAEAELAMLITEYNKSIIESNEKMKAYCKINNLNPETIDVNDLRKVLDINNDNLNIRYSLSDYLKPETATVENYSTTPVFNSKGNRIL